MFGYRIYEFVLSIDIMDQETFFDLLNVIKAYVNKHLDVADFSVLSEAPVNDGKGLQTLWSTRDEEPSYTVVDKEDGYASPIAYSFGKNIPLWIVSEDKSPLWKADHIKNMWPDGENVPTNRNRYYEKVCTSVIHPLWKKGQPIGVVEFAAKKYFEPTPASLKESERLADIISKAYQMFDVRKTQRENTKRAIQLLEEALEKESWRRLDLPQMFVAYPGVERHTKEASTEQETVIATIKNVINNFNDSLTPVYWDEITEPGNITDQVIREICNSEFGLCYFSEPIEEGSFQDNANVLFEAGMMQALRESPGALFKDWIPVRENKAPDIPFDIAAERMLIIDRENGKFNKEAFAEALEERMKKLVEKHLQKFFTEKDNLLPYTFV